MSSGGIRYAWRSALVERDDVYLVKEQFVHVTTLHMKAGIERKKHKGSAALHLRSYYMYKVYLLCYSFQLEANGDGKL
jgi:hypothetical protein